MAYTPYEPVDPATGMTGGEQSFANIQGNMPSAGMYGAPAGADPFAYSNGSLLTPFSGSAPGAINPQLQQVPTGSFTPGSFSASSYSAPQTYTPEGFAFNQGVPSNMNLPGAFQAPTGITAQNDPGYEFRRAEGQRAIQNQATAQGARGGDVLKAFADYNQNYASNEFGNVYNRALTTQGTNYNQALSTYQAQLAAQNQGFQQAFSGSALNNQNTLAAAQLNEQNRLNAFNANTNAGLGAFTANTNAQLGAAQLNNQAILGNNQTALAAANQLYNQQMGQFQTDYGIYNTNQSNQFNRLYSLASLGQNSANQLGAVGSQYGTNLSNLYTGSANAGAAAQAAGGAAWSNAINGFGNTAGAAALYASPFGGMSRSTQPVQSYGLPPIQPGLPAGIPGYSGGFSGYDAAQNGRY